MRRIIKLDADVKQCSVDACAIIAKATARSSPARHATRLTRCASQELFLGSLVAGAHTAMKGTKRKTIVFSDVETSVMRRGKLWFLHDYIGGIGQAAKKAGAKEGKGGAKKKVAPAAPAGGAAGGAAGGDAAAGGDGPTKPKERMLTSFFATAAGRAPDPALEEDKKAAAAAGAEREGEGEGDEEGGAGAEEEAGEEAAAAMEEEEAVEEEEEEPRPIPTRNTRKRVIMDDEDD